MGILLDFSSRPKRDGGNEDFKTLKAYAKQGGGKLLLKHDLMAMTHPVTLMIKAAGIIAETHGGAGGTTGASD